MTNLAQKFSAKIDSVNLRKGDGREVIISDLESKSVSLVYLDPPREHKAPTVEIRTLLSAASNLLAGDAVIATYSLPQDVPSLRTVLETELGPASYRGEMVIPASPIKRDQYAWDITSHVLLLHCVSDMRKFRRPGKWDTLLLSGKTHANSPQAGPTVGHNDNYSGPVGEGVSQGKWEQARSLAAIRNYKNYMTGFAQEYTLDEYYESTLDESGTPLEFLRMNSQGDVQLYLSGNDNPTATNCWMDLESHVSETVHPEERHLPSVIRLLEWMTKPGDLIIDPFTGSGTALVAAAMTGRRALGIELDPTWHSIAHSRLVQHGFTLEGGMP